MLKNCKECNDNDWCYDWDFGCDKLGVCIFTQAHNLEALTDL